MRNDINLRDIALLMRFGTLTTESKQFVFKPFPGKENLFDLPPHSYLKHQSLHRLLEIALTDLTATQFDVELDF